VAPVNAFARLFGCYWPMITAVILYGLSPHYQNPAWTWLQIAGTVFLAYALRQLEREVASRAALLLYGPRRVVLRREPQDYPPVTKGESS
jgi:hypothetical protein